MATATLISKLAATSAKVGALATDKTNTQQNYSYISADKILERAGAALAQAGIVIVPSIIHEETATIEYTDNYGKAKSRFDCVVHFAMIISDGDTQLEMPWRGRGSDYAVPDKAMYKAITSGHKYFIMKLLNIGVGNEDGEHENEPAAQDATQPPQASKPTRAPADAPQRASTPAKSEARQDPAAAKFIDQLNALGEELYADTWPQVREHNTRRVSKERTAYFDELTAAEMQALIGGMNKVKSERLATERLVENAEPVAH